MMPQTTICRRRRRRRQFQDRAARHVLLFTAAIATRSQQYASTSGIAGTAAFGLPQPAAAFLPASTTRNNRHLQRSHSRSSSYAGASIDTLETTCENHDGNSSPQTQTHTHTNTPAPTIHRDLISQTIINSVKQRGSESYRRSYNKWSSTALERIQTQLGQSLPVAPDADATAQLGFELGVAADYGQMPSFGNGGARAGYALDYFCRVKLLGDVLFGERMNAWRREQQQQQQDQSSAVHAPSYLGDSITDLLCTPNREVCRIGSLGGGPGFDHVAATVLATHAALEREVQYCIDTNAEASFPDDAEESDSLPRLAVEDILSHLSSRTTPPMPRIETTVYEYEAGWDDIIPYMDQSTQSVLDLGSSQPHSCRFAGCDITLPLTHNANAECYQQAQSTDLWICSYCVAENAIRLRANDYVFFVELFEAAQEGAVFVFTETTHRLWPEIIDVATKANSENGREAAGGFDVAFPRIQRGRGKAGFQLALRKASGATLGEDVQATCERFRRDNAMHELKISGGYKRQKRKIRGAK